MDRLLTFLRFCRPHTIIATSLQVIGMFILTQGYERLGQGALSALALTIVACLSVNIYVVGLNQVTDVEIDRINKPNLPLAAGKYSLRQGRILVAVFGVLAVGLAAAQGAYLFLTIVLTLIIGTLYSVQPPHLKTRPLWAALSIAFVRGVVANVGLFLHFSNTLFAAPEIAWLQVFGLALFFFGFGLVIALYKDIPDLSGDRQFGVRTFTVRLGPKTVFQGGRLILTAFYLVPVIAALVLLPGSNGLLLLIPHLAIILLFWRVSWNVDVTRPAVFTRFYMFLWSLFYAEYILLSLNAIVSSQVASAI
ncbi:MAG: homogentisate phytyltransferase [Chloroflexota bacterium]|nr:MAG: homogentisate phytyltransferase [Chloroflexota bacterium]